MADQRKITLRPGNATPRNIVLRELPAPNAAATTTIRLYAGHPTPSTIILGDPTVTRPSGGGTTRTITGSGGIVFGGSATLNREHTITGDGGIVFGGVATLNRDRALAASGGITFGGSGTLARERTITASGGIVFGGSATLARERTIAGDGGLVFGGSGTLARERTITGAGGIVFGGAATLERVTGGVTRSITGDGGIVFGGEATLDRVTAPAPPTPDPTPRAGMFGAGYPIPIQRPPPARQRVIHGRGGIRFAGDARLVRRRDPSLAILLLAD